MFTYTRSRAFFGIIHSLLVIVLALSFTAAGLATQPEEETAPVTTYLPFIFKIVSYRESIGVLDISFSVDGWALTNYMGSLDNGYSADLQEDGKLVVAGSYDGTSRNFGLARFNPDGSLDTSFDGDGRVVTDFSGSYEDAYAVKVQDDGKILVAGSSDNGNLGLDFALARYNPDGTLDSTFGSGGKVLTNFVDKTDVATALLLLPDNKILAAGYAVNGSYYDFALARYTADGIPDPTFSDDGKMLTDLSGKSDYAYALILQPDNKIVAAGYADNNFALARYDLDGNPDITFSEDGEVTTNFGGTDRGRALVRQGDGKLVVAGTVDLGGNINFGVARYTTAGVLDGTFDGDGMVTTDFAGSADNATAVTMGPGGSIVVSGYTFTPSGNNLALARYTSNGALDGSFGSSGRVTADYSGMSEYGRALISVSDDRLFVVGDMLTVAGSDFLVARFNSNGSLDTTFNGDGWAITNLYGSYDQAMAAALQADGKLVLAGTVNDGSGADIGLARYSSNGTLDTSFDSDGKAVTSVNGYDEAVHAILVQADGRLLVAGAVNNGLDDDFALLRYNWNGSLDTFFGVGGLVVADYGIDADIAYAAVLLPDGKIVLAGQAETGSSQDFALLRINQDGSPDTTFGSGGWVVTDFNGGDDGARAIILMEDGRLMVAGVAANGATTDFAVARYMASGGLDPSFGSNGKLTTDFGINNNDEATALVLQPDGKLVLAGWASNGTSADFALARYNPNGGLDNSFDGDGKVTTSLSPGDDHITSLGLQPNDKLVVAGRAHTATGCDIALARYTAEGDLDPEFSEDGWLVQDFYAGDDSVQALIMLPKGPLLVAGFADNGTDFDFVTVRYR